MDVLQNGLQAEVAAGIQQPQPMPPLKAEPLHGAKPADRIQALRCGWRLEGASAITWQLRADRIALWSDHRTVQAGYAIERGEPIHRPDWEEERK